MLMDRVRGAREQSHRHPIPDGTMIVSFKDEGTRDVYEHNDTRRARQVCPPELWSVAGRKLDQIEGAHTLGELVDPPGNRLERLKGGRAGQYSIRINHQYRICFWWTGRGAEAVGIVDYH
jgi:proteic killer suppression protein